MMTLITAVPGSGKSLYSIGLILEGLKAGRSVYSNIAGLKIHGVKPAPDDWRDTPEGSLVIYDEAQQEHLFPSTGHRGEVKDERLRAMEVHRHTGHDLVFISQSPSFLHHHIRRLVGRHIHLYRSSGIQGAMVYTWSHSVNDPNDRGEQGRADAFAWKFPKEHYKLYESATKHTHKFKMPKKLAMMLAIILCCFSAAIYLMLSNDNSLIMGSAAEVSFDSRPNSSSEPITFSGSVGRETAAPEKVMATTTEFDWASTETASSVAGCVFNDRFCRCYSHEGKLMKMGKGQCMSVASLPIPRDILVGKSSSNKKGKNDGDAGSGLVSGESQATAAKSGQAVGTEGQAL